MNNMNLKILIATLALTGFGCSRSSSSGSSDPSTGVAATYVPVDSTVVQITNPTTTTTTAATNTVTFTPVSTAEMQYYAGHALYAPTNFKLTVNLTNDGTNRFYGGVAISYVDAGYQYSGSFESGSGTNPYLAGSNSNYLKQYAYNVWFNLNSKTVFSGFFQDTYGGVVLVIDSVTTAASNNSDGLAGTAVLGGSIWYRNFNPPYGSAPQGPMRNCWYISQGPYDCRSSAVIYKNALEPSDTYRKLGTFSGLSMSAAMK